jgi:hypothetical protein
MTSRNDGTGNPGGNSVVDSAWVQGPENRVEDAGNNTPMIGKWDAEANKKADETYFGKKNSQVSDVMEPKVLVQGKRITSSELVEALLAKKELGFEYKVQCLFDEAFALLIDKHKVYGPTNVANAPGGPLNGLRVRMHDKTARLNNIIDNDPENNFESLRDTFMDLANYALIACLVLDGDWPGVE